MQIFSAATVTESKRKTTVFVTTVENRNQGFFGATWAVLTKAFWEGRLRERSLYAMGGTLHPRLNMQTIIDACTLYSNLRTCALSQFLD